MCGRPSTNFAIYIVTRLFWKTYNAISRVQIFTRVTQNDSIWNENIFIAQPKQTHLSWMSYCIHWWYMVPGLTFSRICYLIIWEMKLWRTFENLMQAYFKFKKLITNLSISPEDIEVDS